MEQLYKNQLSHRETVFYMNITLISGLILFVVALALNIVAALVSHIALWQVLVWLSTTSLVIAVLAVFLHWWLAKNNLTEVETNEFNR